MPGLHISSKFRTKSNSRPKFWKKTSSSTVSFFGAKQKQLLTKHLVLWAAKLSAFGSGLSLYIYATAKSAYAKCNRFVENSPLLLCRP